MCIGFFLKLCISERQILLPNSTKLQYLTTFEQNIFVKTSFLLKIKEKMLKFNKNFSDNRKKCIIALSYKFIMIQLLV